MGTMAGSGSAVVTLPQDTQILITRGFDAPRHLVWRAYTEPDLVKRWWSGERGEVTSVEIDLRVGGRWRYVMVANAGFEVAFHGDVPRDRAGRAARLDRAVRGRAGRDRGRRDREHHHVRPRSDGRTTLTTLVECHTREIRDMIIESGMEGGMQEAMDRLEEVARSLA